MVYYSQNNVFLLDCCYLGFQSSCQHKLRDCCLLIRGGIGENVWRQQHRSELQIQACVCTSAEYGYMTASLPTTKNNNKKTHRSHTLPDVRMCMHHSAHTVDISIMCIINILPNYTQQWPARIKSVTWHGGHYKILKSYPLLIKS